MKLYCELCSKTQPVRIDICRDAKTNEPYQDIVCAECDFVIASGTDITQPEQEPVAWIREDGVIGNYDPADYGYGMKVTPLYIAPPKREWKSLTPDDKHFLLANAWNKEQAFDGFMDAIDKFLEEKNT